MYHKMPLQKSHKDKKHLKNRHNKASLSPKHQMTGTLQEASYDTYPLIRKQVQPEASITLEMVVVLPLFISFMVFFLFVQSENQSAYL